MKPALLTLGLVELLGRGLSRTNPAAGSKVTLALLATCAGKTLFEAAEILALPNAHWASSVVLMTLVLSGLAAAALILHSHHALADLKQLPLRRAEKSVAAMMLLGILGLNLPLVLR